MKIAIRDWQPADFKPITTHWLAAYARVALPDAPLKPNAAELMRTWLRDRFHDRKALGYVASLRDEFAGFLLARVGDWESDPPIVKRRRVGVIDVVYVLESHRRSGVGRRLVQHVIERAGVQGVSALETTFETLNEPAAQLWRSQGFVSWIQRAYLPIGGRKV